MNEEDNTMFKIWNDGNYFYCMMWDNKKAIARFDKFPKHNMDKRLYKALYGLYRSVKNRV